MKFLNTFWLVSALSYATFAFEFIEHTPLNKTFAEINQKYKSLIQKDQCRIEIESACIKKFKAKCECYQIPLVRYQAHSETLYLSVYKGRVVEYNYSKAVTPNNFKTTLQTVEALAGGDLPSSIHGGSGSNGIQPYILTWFAGDTSVLAAAWCPLELNGGVRKSLSPLRKCYERGHQGTIIRSLKVDSKQVQVEY